MGHINQKNCPYGISHLAKTGKINDARVSAGAGNNHLGPVLFGQLTQFFIINQFGVLANPIRNNFVQLAGKIQMMPMRQVSAMRQVE